MPTPKYNYNVTTDLYTSMYEQYYFKNTPVRKIKKAKKSNKKTATPLKKFCSFLFATLLLFFVFPYSFKSYYNCIFPINVKNPLNVNYEKLLHPANDYLYKDLFLGKYALENPSYDNYLMTDIPENVQRYNLRNRLLALANEYPKIQPAVYVWESSGKSFVDINADTIYPAASTIKVPVLIEMFRNIEHGKLSLDNTILFEDFYRAPGSGKLQFSEGGIEHSLDYLARIMIENSDNSATNMIMAKMGSMPEINKAMKRWGLKYTRINTWLPDLDGTNVTTAREMAKMFYNINYTNFVNTDSKGHIADYMGHVKNNRLLQAGLPEGAVLLHKTGDIGYMLGDAGIVKTASGKRYIVVILAMRPYNSIQGKDFIVKASEIIYNNIEF